MGVAVVGAIVPFAVSFGIATWFGLDWVGATFVGLTMTATAVVITLKSLKDLGLANTRFARIIIASCVIDVLLTLVFFGLIVGVLAGGSFEPLGILITLGKVVAFFAISLLIGKFVYPRLTLPFRSEGGKGFTFILVTAIGAGLFAEAFGECARVLRALFHADAGDRDEGADVHASEARVFACVLGHVDELGGHLPCHDGRFDDVLRFTCEGDDGAVRRGTGVDVEELHPVHGLDGVGDPLDHRHISPLAEVGDALDESFHVWLWGDG